MHYSTFLTLPMPSHKLTLNGTRNRLERARLAKEHKHTAFYAALAAVSPQHRPWFPSTARIRVRVDVERHRGGKRWDNAALIEAMKPYMDGIEESGALYTNDRQLDWDGGIHWDPTPTGTGVIRLTFWTADPG